MRDGDYIMYDLENVLSKIFILENIPYSFQYLSNEASMIPYDEGAVIVSEGEPGSGLYVIFSGEVVLYNTTPTGQEKVLRTLGPRDYFNEMDLIDDGICAFSARATEQSILYCLEKKTFFGFLQSNPLMYFHVITNLCNRIRQLEYKNGILSQINNRLSESLIESSHEVIKDYTPDGIAADPIMHATGAASGSVAESTDSFAHGFAFETEYPLDIPGGHLHQDGSEELVDRNANESTPDNDNIDSTTMLYHKKVDCPLCQTNFNTPKVLSKFIQVAKIDYDYCMHYQYINPLFYEINVCPTCGFAFNEEIGGIRLKKDDETELTALLPILWEKDRVTDYDKDRSLDKALNTFHIALNCVSFRPVKKSILAMLYLKIAWLYRYQGNEELELEYLSKALDNFTLSFDRESFPTKKAEINTIYLLGVLCMKTGKYQESTKWLERVLRHPVRNSFPMVVDKAREVWSDVRAIMKEQELKN